MTAIGNSYIVEDEEAFLDQVMASCIAFHSYKRGTGKTTIAANLAAKRGYPVFLLDLDAYAPSLQAYFDKEPKRWINDFLNGTAEVGDIIMDLTSIVEKCVDNKNSFSSNSKEKERGKLTGKLWVCFCNSKKEEIYKLEGGGKQTHSKTDLLRRSILLREQLISNYKADYVIGETSPGIRYWSINALAIADILILTLKIGDLDIDGTKMMPSEISSSLEKLGTKRFLLLNKVTGYCVPATIGNASKSSMPEAFGHIFHHADNLRSNIIVQQQEEFDISNMLSNKIGMDIIASIPCYCDIQFTKKEFLTALNSLIILLQNRWDFLQKNKSKILQEYHTIGN